MNKYNTTKGEVYSLLNKINGKRYIGLTTRGVSNRVKEHKVADSYIGRAIRKHGIESFEVEVLEETKKVDELPELEIKWIKHYESFETGYNLTSGGDGCNTRVYFDVQLNDRQQRFVRFVRDNSSEMDGVKLLVFMLAKMFVVANSKEDKRLVASTIAKLKPNYIKAMSEFKVIDKEELLSYL